METAKAIVAGITGTTAMTAFSYILSEKRDENFREPQLLANMIRKMMPAEGKESAFKAGWVLHYGVGIFFSFVYKYFLRKLNVNANVKNGSVIGGTTGLIAIGVWSLTFNLHVNPPIVHHRKFYGQLVVAHIIFGIVTILLLGRKRKHGGKFHITTQKQLKNMSDGSSL